MKIAIFTSAWFYYTIKTILEGYLYLTEFGLQACKDRRTQMNGEFSDCGVYDDGSLQVNINTLNSYALNLDSKHGESFDYNYWVKMQPDSSPFSTFYADKPEGELKDQMNRIKQVIVDGSWKAIYAEDDVLFEQIVQNMREDAVNNGYDECVSFSRENAKKRYEIEQKEN